MERVVRSVALAKGYRFTTNLVLSRRYGLAELSMVTRTLSSLSLSAKTAILLFIKTSITNVTGSSAPIVLCRRSTDYLDNMPKITVMGQKRIVSWRQWIDYNTLDILGVKNIPAHWDKDNDLYCRNFIMMDGRPSFDGYLKGKKLFIRDSFTNGFSCQPSDQTQETSSSTA